MAFIINPFLFNSRNFSEGIYVKRNHEERSVLHNKNLTQNIIVKPSGVVTFHNSRENFFSFWKSCQMVYYDKQILCFFQVTKSTLPLSYE